ncbi:EamA/RhaT family transporter [Corallincola holothuriorum]|uniref:EamA/RhaT family transporter n=1 Tax=Corallincola holothuriorum TaxID=2282215 RepID=A0A368NPV2_9GAMM|nr:DMT family transporter [Corallincola holothuriorum]RCU51489.1 EamA/RhaT family transporter [Corallincola holothuriorum]
MTDSGRSLCYLHGSVLLFGGTALFAKLIPLPALEITVFRCVVAALFLASFLLVSGKKLRLACGKDYLIALFLGVLVGFHWVTYFAAMQLAGIAIGMIALFSFPVMTVVLEPLFNKQLPHKADLFAAVAVLAGIILMVPAPSFGNEVTLGIATGLFSALLYTLRNIFHKRLFSRYSGPQAMSYQTAVAAIILSALLEIPPTDVSPHSWMLLALLGILFTAMPHAMVAESLRKLPAKTVGLVSCLQPLYGTLAAIWILNEYPSLTTVIGGSIVISAAIWETWRAQRR